MSQHSKEKDLLTLVFIFTITLYSGIFLFSGNILTSNKKLTAESFYSESYSNDTLDSDINISEEEPLEQGASYKIFTTDVPQPTKLDEKHFASTTATTSKISYKIPIKATTTIPIKDGKVSTSTASTTKIALKIYGPWVGETTREKVYIGQRARFITSYKGPFYYECGTDGTLTEIKPDGTFYCVYTSPGERAVTVNHKNVAIAFKYVQIFTTLPATTTATSTKLPNMATSTATSTKYNFATSTITATSTLNISTTTIATSTKLATSTINVGTTTIATSTKKQNGVGSFIKSLFFFWK